MMAHYYIHKRWMRKKNLYMHIDIRWATITGISENLHTLYVCVHVIHWMWWTCMFFSFGCYIYEKLNSSMCKIQYHNLLQTIFSFYFEYTIRLLWVIKYLMSLITNMAVDNILFSLSSQPLLSSHQHHQRQRMKMKMKM